MYLAGVAVYCAGVLLTLYVKGLPLTVFLNPAAVLLLLFAMVAVLTATQSYPVFKNGLAAVVFPKKVISEDLRGKAASLFRLLSKVVGLTAGIGFVISVMAALRYLSDVEALAHALSTAFAIAVWALLLIAAVFEPAVAVLKKRQDSERSQKNKV